MSRKTKYLEVAQIIRSSIKQTRNKQLKEYLGRTAISRAYEAVFLEIYYYITDDLKTSYTQMKRIAKEYYKQKGLKVPINKHTAVGAYIAMNYGEVYGRMYNELRNMRNKVDYYIEIGILITIPMVDMYIKIAEIILNEVVSYEDFK
ncbi:MAG: hypothetical protein GXO22_06715 [Aquificae bacterium]|nr:hypothetical protein [Aquificota bacterium]